MKEFARGAPLPDAVPLTLPAWFPENPSVGGAVFSGRTAGNDAYQPPADPPRQALSSCPARSSVFFFSPWLSRSKFRL